MMKKFRTLALILVLMSVFLANCGTVQRVSHEHDKLVALYEQADMARSSAKACYDLKGGEVRTSFAVFNSMLDANNEAVKAWKEGQLKEAEAKLAEAQAAYRNTKDSDLNAAVEQGGTPTDIANAYALQIKAYAEAPWQGFGEAASMRLMDTISEAYSTTLGCVNDWNSAVSAYNIERNRIEGLVDSGRVVGDAANALGLDEMPRKLPYYESPEGSPQIGTDFVPQK